MKFALLINSAPFSQQAANTAYNYCQAALNQGHSIVRIFFYMDGVYNANTLIDPPQDETNLVIRWQQLAEKNNIELAICVASATRRGIIDTNLAPSFKITGLGQLIDAILTADRLITFN